MSGFSLVCPVCTRPLLPRIGLLHYMLAPRWAHHMTTQHPYEAVVLREHLVRPPAEWPELIEGDEAVAEAFGR